MKPRQLLDAYARADANAAQCYQQMRRVWAEEGDVLTPAEGHATAQRQFSAAFRSWCHLAEIGEIKLFKP